MSSRNGDPGQAAEEPVTPGHPAAVSAVRRVPAPEPLLPERSVEDTDAAWGDYPEPSSDRLYRDRPPHWDDF